MVDSNSVFRRPSVHNQRNTAAQLIAHMLRRCWADAPEPVCARRGQRPIQFPDKLRGKSDGRSSAPPPFLILR